MSIVRSVILPGILLTTLLGACTKPDTQSKATTPETVAAIDSTTDIDFMVGDSALSIDSSSVTDEAKPDAADQQLEADTVAFIKFNELTVRLSPLRVEAEDKLAVTQLQRDSVVFSAGLNSYVEDNVRLAIATDHLIDVAVDERIEVALLINTAEHEELSYLIESTRRYSPWRPLRYNSRHEFVRGNYPYRSLIYALGMSLQQLKQVIKTNGDSADYATIRNARSLREADEAVEVVIETYHFRITGYRKDTGQAVTKHIIFYAQMGC